RDQGAVPAARGQAGLLLRLLRGRSRQPRLLGGADRARRERARAPPETAGAGHPRPAAREGDQSRMTAPVARMVVKLKRRSGAKKKPASPRTAPAGLLQRRPMPPLPAPGASVARGPA